MYLIDFFICRKIKKGIWVEVVYKGLWGFLLFDSF